MPIDAVLALSAAMLVICSTIVKDAICWVCCAASIGLDGSCCVICATSSFRKPSLSSIALSFWTLVEPLAATEVALIALICCVVSGEDVDEDAVGEDKGGLSGLLIAREPVAAP